MPRGSPAHLVRDAGGDPDLLKTAAEERLERLPQGTGSGPHPIYMSPELAGVLQAAVEAARTSGDRFVTAERLLAAWRRRERCARCSRAPASTRRPRRGGRAHAPGPQGGRAFGRAELGGAGEIRPRPDGGGARRASSIR